MPKCSYCGARAGKRPCPALGAVCSQCCGQHRGREIKCPADCAYLRPAHGQRTGAMARLLDAYGAWLGQADSELLQRAAKEFLGDGDYELDPEFRDSLLLWIAIGFEITPKERQLDRFAAAHEAALPAEERHVLSLLRHAAPSLIGVCEAHAGSGFHAVNLLTDARFFVHESQGSRTLAPGDILLTWVLRDTHHCELGPAACLVPPHEAVAIAEALQGEIHRQRRKDAAASRAVCTRRALPAAYRALMRARRAGLEAQAQATRHSAASAVYVVRDPGQVRARLDQSAQVTRVAEGRWHWSLPHHIEPSDERAAIEIDIVLERVRLTLMAQSPAKLDAGKRAVRRLLGDTVEHRLDELPDGRTQSASRDPPPVAAAAATGVDDDIHAFHRVLDESMLHFEKERAQRASAERALALARQQRHRMPPLAHESMYHLVPGMRAAIAQCVARLRQAPPAPPAPLPLIDSLLEHPPFADFLRAHMRTTPATWNDEQRATEAAILSHHAHYALCYELRHKKTFWVDDGLAWMLSATELDIRGACLELPFDAFALAFTDGGTLALAEQCLAHTDDCRLRGVPLEILTVYVTNPPEVRADGARALSVSFLFEAGDGGWPYMLNRDLNVLPDADLDSILTSRGPLVDTTNLDPVFVSPELEKLLHIALNAILYATSAHLEPILLQPDADHPARRARQRRREQQRAHRSLESACWLAGKIDIARVHQLRALDETAPGRQLSARFLVRGHWRRAAPHWVDQRLRWIEPHWKGPDLATVIERDYRLRP